MIYSMLTNAQLCRAISTTKNYIVLDMGYACNHSPGKVTFTNNVSEKLFNEQVLIADLSDVTGLHFEVENMVDRVAKALTRDCYYDSFENNLKSYDLTPYLHHKALKWLDR